MNFLTNPNPNKLELNVFVLTSELSKEKMMKRTFITFPNLFLMIGIELLRACLNAEHMMQ
jgi:hypothetical protein